MARSWARCGPASPGHAGAAGKLGGRSACPGHSRVRPRPALPRTRRGQVRTRSDGRPEGLSPPIARGTASRARSCAGRTLIALRTAAAETCRISPSAEPASAGPRHRALPAQMQMRAAVSGVGPCISARASCTGRRRPRGGSHITGCERAPPSRTRRLSCTSAHTPTRDHVEHDR